MQKLDPKYDALFTPWQVGNVEIKNRIVMCPMGGTSLFGWFELGGCHFDKEAAKLFLERANNNVGLIIPGIAPLRDTFWGKWLWQNPKMFDDLKVFMDEIHKTGAKLFVQLTAGMGRSWAITELVAPLHKNKVTRALIKPIIDTSHELACPSPQPARWAPDIECPEMTVEQIHEIIEAFAKTAKLCKEAGVDGVEVHAVHEGYLLDQFAIEFFNKRTDEYGGSLENRARFLLECIRSIRANVPEDMPLFMRIDAHDDNLDNGLSIEDVIQFCKWAKEAGVDVLDVSRGNFSSAAIKYEVPPVDLPRGFNVENAARIKKETGMLTVAVGRINDPEQADEIIKSGKADMVVIGRAQLADPEFCNKAMNGNIKDIIRCVGCNQGCYDGFSSPDVPFITCMRNPALGREAEFTLEKTNNPKKVLIVGGGVAGLQAAMELKDRNIEYSHKTKTNILNGVTFTSGPEFFMTLGLPFKETDRKDRN